MSHVCIYPFKSKAQLDEVSSRAPIECTWQHCPRPGIPMGLNFNNRAPGCSYRRVGIKKTRGDTTINHSKRICEYDMTDSKLSYHHNRGRYSCASEGCEHRIDVGDRVVRLAGVGGPRIFCAACASDRGII